MCIQYKSIKDISSTLQDTDTSANFFSTETYIALQLRNQPNHQSEQNKNNHHYFNAKTTDNHPTLSTKLPTGAAVELIHVQVYVNRLRIVSGKRCTQFF